MQYEPGKTDPLTYLRPYRQNLDKALENIDPEIQEVNKVHSSNLEMLVKKGSIDPLVQFSMEPEDISDYRSFVFELFEKARQIRIELYEFNQATFAHKGLISTSDDYSREAENVLFYNYLKLITEQFKSYTRKLKELRQELDG